MYNTVYSVMYNTVYSDMYKTCCTQRKLYILCCTVYIVHSLHMYTVYSAMLYIVHCTVYVYNVHSV